MYLLFHRLSRYQDRATEHLRPNSRKKKITLVYVSHLRLVGEPHTVGCPPMCCPLIHCMAAFHCEDVLCLEGFSARSPGSWQGGSCVSALLSVLFAGHLRKILLSVLVFCVGFYARSCNSVTSSASPLWSCLVRALFVVFLFLCGFCFFVFLFFSFLGFPCVLGLT